jgi:hypothetical protein
MHYQNPHGPTCPWHQITEKVGAPNIKWCEETLCQWISEPANTWSNLSYIIFGLVLFGLSLRKNHPWQLKIYGPIIVIVGLASFYYHLSNFYISQILDFVGMFFFVAWAIGMNLYRLHRLKLKNLLWFITAYSVVFTVLLHLMYRNEMKFQILIIISAIIIVLTEFSDRRPAISRKWFFIALSGLATAFIFTFVDHNRIWCEPTNHGWFSQGHALWHWFSGLGMFFVYFHYAQPALNKQETK